MSRGPDSSASGGVRPRWRLALLFVIAGVLLVTSALLAVIRDSDPASGAARPATELPAPQRIGVLVTVLIIIFLLFLGFLLGSFIIVRLGRYLKRERSRSQTAYVDAWSRYRVTQEQIDTATGGRGDATGGAHGEDV